MFVAEASVSVFVADEATALPPCAPPVLSSSPPVFSHPRASSWSYVSSYQTISMMIPNVVASRNHEMASVLVSSG